MDGVGATDEGVEDQRESPTPTLLSAVGALWNHSSCSPLKTMEALKDARNHTLNYDLKAILLKVPKFDNL